MLLIENQVARGAGDGDHQDASEAASPGASAQRRFVREKIAEQLEKLIPTAGPIVRTKTTGPHVVALIGPTGVGKTTTIAKLAANLKLRREAPVGLITIDTYRIAADRPAQEIRRHHRLAAAWSCNARGSARGDRVDERLRFRPDRHRRPKSRTTR